MPFSMRFSYVFTVHQPLPQCIQEINLRCLLTIPLSTTSDLCFTTAKHEVCNDVNEASSQTMD